MNAPLGIFDKASDYAEIFSLRYLDSAARKVQRMRNPSRL